MRKQGFQGVQEPRLFAARRRDETGVQSHVHRFNQIGFKVDDATEG